MKVLGDPGRLGLSGGDSQVEQSLEEAEQLPAADSLSISVWAALPGHCLPWSTLCSLFSLVPTLTGVALQAWLSGGFLLPGFDGGQGCGAQENLCGVWVFFAGQSPCFRFSATSVWSWSLSIVALRALRPSPPFADSTSPHLSHLSLLSFLPFV